MNRILSLRLLRHVRQGLVLTLALISVAPSATAAEEVPAKAGSASATNAVPRRERRAAADRMEAARARRDATMADLGLTDEQRDKLRAAQKAQTEKLRAVREDSSLSRDQKAAKTRELRDDLMAATKSILTAEQFEKWQKSRESRRARPGRPSAGPSPEAAPDAGK